VISGDSHYEKEATIYPDNTVWKNLLQAYGEKINAAKFTISALSLFNIKPTGFCIQAFATKIQRADILEPKTTIHIAKQCVF